MSSYFTFITSLGSIMKEQFLSIAQGQFFEAFNKEFDWSRKVNLTIYVDIYI